MEASGRASHCERLWAEASLAERIGLEAGQSMPIWGSFQAMPDSVARL